MTKDQLKSELGRCEPDNPVVKNSRSTHQELSSELKACRRRQASRDRANSTPAALVYRIDQAEGSEDGVVSWRLRADGAYVTELQHGDSHPELDAVLPDDGGRPYRVIEHIEGLPIKVGDLSVREEFDPRRVYLSPNGTAVAFKRVDGHRVILWSYRQSQEIMLGRDVELALTDRRARPVAAANRRMTQKDLAAYLISTVSDITAEQLTEELRLAFPSANVGSRHGPHYLSLSRNGKLPEPPDSDPREW